MFHLPQDKKPSYMFQQQEQVRTKATRTCHGLTCVCVAFGAVALQCFLQHRLGLGFRLP